MRAWTAFVQLLLLGAGCTYYDSSLLVPSGAGGGGQAGGAGQAGDSCEHVQPPNKASGTGAGGTLDLVFAVSEIWFEEDPAKGRGVVGYDIDRTGTCTCEGDNDSCLEPSWANGDHCDLPGGRDNAFGKLMQDMVAFSGLGVFGVETWNNNLKEGAWGVAVRVRNYNGLSDDDQVELSWYMTSKYWALSQSLDGGKPQPKWDGTDQWPVRDTSVIQGDVDKPAYADTNAYVSGGVLVGMLPKGMFQADPALTVVLTDPYLTGRLVKDGAHWQLKDGRIAAVWQLPDIFEQFNYITILNQPLCKDSGNLYYAGLKGAICKHADIFHDRGTPTTPCDSLSLGAGFTASEAKLGGVAVSEPSQRLCDPAHDPATDTCGS